MPLRPVISTYLLTTSLANIIEGADVAGVMYAWGMQSPFLWGALVVAFEFIPYLGSVAMVVILSIAVATTYDTIGAQTASSGFKPTNQRRSRL